MRRRFERPAFAQAAATKLGVTITATVARAEDYDWGENRWDLIGGTHRMYETNDAMDAQRRVHRELGR